MIHIAHVTHLTHISYNTTLMYHHHQTHLTHITSEYRLVTTPDVTTTAPQQDYVLNTLTNSALPNQNYDSSNRQRQHDNRSPPNPLKSSRWHVFQRVRQTVSSRSIRSHANATSDPIGTDRDPDKPNEWDGLCTLKPLNNHKCRKCRQISRGRAVDERNILLLVTTLG